MPSGPTVKATERGVAIEIATTSSATDLAFLAMPKDGGTQLGGNVPVSERPSTLDFPAPAGDLTLTCRTEDGTPVGEPATVTVYDPDRYYQAVDAKKVLGCEPKPAADGEATPARSTRQDALDRLAAQLGPKDTVTITPGPGYKGAAGAVLLVVKRGKGYGTAIAERSSNGSWTARVTARC